MMAWWQRLITWILFPPVYYPRQKIAAALQGKTILITGASFGIGAALVDTLASFNVRLLLVARTKERLVLLQEKHQQQAADIRIFSVDLTQKTAVTYLLQEVQQLDGGVDIVVSNAGRSIRRSIWDSLDRLHDTERCMAINYFAPIQLLLGLLPQLREQQGHILQVSAANVLLTPAPKWGAYQASKAAFDQWFRCVAAELEASGICCSTLYLPLVRTRMIAPTASYQQAPAMQPQQVAKILARLMQTQKRIYKPWWLIFGEIGSFVFARPLRWIMRFVARY